MGPSRHAKLLPPMVLFAALAQSEPGWADEIQTASIVPPESFYQLTGAAPSGFEHLAAPQRALIDVYFGKRHIATVLSTYTPEFIAFDDPDAIVAALPAITAPEEIRRALSGNLATNAASLCDGFQQEEDCGVLAPEHAAVIFNDEIFRADVFVNPQLLAVQPVMSSRFLPPPESGFSALQNFRATAAGSNRSDSLVTIGSFTTIAYEENRLVSEASYSDADKLTFDHLYLQRDDQGVEYLGGIFRTSGRAPSFSGAQDIGGIRVASTLNTRTDLAFAYGTPLSVSLASRARVDILKDDRLISSQFYEAGNQMLDTSMLPEGAYDIVIRINEGGRSREEITFFSKSSRLPPLDQPLYTFELGALLDPSATSVIPEQTGEWVSRLGHSRRLTQTFGVDVGAAVNDVDQLLEVGAFQIDALPGLDSSYYEIQAAAFVGTADSLGVSVRGQLRFGAVYAAADFRKVTGSHLAEGEPPDYSLIPPELTQGNLTLQFPLLGGVAGITASETRRNGNGDTRRQTFTYRRTLLQTPSGTAEFRADLNHDDDQLLALVGVRFYMHRGTWSGEVTPRYRYDDLNPNPPGHGYQLDASSLWSNPDFANGALRLAANGSSNRQADSAGLSMDYDNRFAQTSLSVDHINQGSYSETGWAGTVVSSVLSSGDAWSLGAQNNSDAAILVTLDGKSPDTEFEVIVDGYRRGYATGDATTALQLPAYHTYEVAIRPRRSTFVDFDDSPRSVTLYPGNVARLAWEVEELAVVLGRLVDGAGHGISNASLRGAHGFTMTNAEGYFQAELRSSDDKVHLLFAIGDQQCEIEAPIVKKRSGVAFLDTLACDLAPPFLQAEATADKSDQNRRRSD